MFGIKIWLFLGSLYTTIRSPKVTGMYNHFKNVYLYSKWNLFVFLHLEKNKNNIKTEYEMYIVRPLFEIYSTTQKFQFSTGNTHASNRNGYNFWITNVRLKINTLVR